jgi:predicted nucleic acid-binding protein
MSKLKIYLDNCSYNRPFDDQNQVKIYLESVAKLHVQADIRGGKHILVWSYMSDYENNSSPYDEKRKAIAVWKDIAVEFCPPSNDILELGRKFMALGLKEKDSLHIACAVKSGCEYFITTDKKVLNKSRNISEIQVIDPIRFLTETEGNDDDKK